MAAQRIALPSVAPYEKELHVMQARCALSGLPARACSDLQRLASQSFSINYSRLFSTTSNRDIIALSTTATRQPERKRNVNALRNRPDYGSPLPDRLRPDRLDGHSHRPQGGLSRGAGKKPALLFGNTPTNEVLMPYDRHHYAQCLSVDQIKRMIRETEDRQSRADTAEAATLDAYTLQELHAALKIKAQPVPPDPEDRNGTRAADADTALRIYRAETGTGEDDAIARMLAGLMHLCDRTGQEFARELGRAQQSYATETTP